MNILRATALTLLLIFSLVDFGKANISAIDTTQKTVIAENKNGYRKRMNALTKDQINQLNDGALLIRLKTKKNSIEALRKIGKNNLADKVEAKQRTYNLKIVMAFKTKFNFCPTYFFYSDYSDNVRKKLFDEVRFLSENLVEDTTIKFNKSHFLTAEFGVISQDTAKYFLYYNNEAVENWNIIQVANHHGGADLGIGALIIMSEQFIQLRRPFPFYVRTFSSLAINRRPKKTVKKMNRKLHRFYDYKN